MPPVLFIITRIPPNLPPKTNNFSNHLRSTLKRLPLAIFYITKLLTLSPIISGIFRVVYELLLMVDEQSAPLAVITAWLGEHRLAFRHGSAKISAGTTKT